VASRSTSASERATFAALAALLALVLCAACAEGRLTGAEGPAPYARVAVTAVMPAQLAAQTRTLVVTAGYVRAAAQPVAVPLDSAAVAVTVGPAVDVPVQINLTACLADPAHEVPTFVNGAPAASTAPACLLHLGLALLDASGAVIARTQVLVLASAGATVTAGPVAFQAPSAAAPPD
jgi:hypothetical protein